MLVKGSMEDVSVFVNHEVLRVCWHTGYIFIGKKKKRLSTNKEFQAQKREHFSIVSCEVYAQGCNMYVHMIGVLMIRNVFSSC